MIEVKLYNTLTRKIEKVKPLINNQFRIYSCGPTIYNFAHIGNLRYFVFVDILRKTLKFFGYDVKHVMNLTDVDDKTVKGSQKQGISLREYTDKYKEYFFEDLKSLNIEKVEYYPRATENIAEIIQFIQKLIDNDFAYVKDNNVYFDVSKFKDYGKLAHLDLSTLKHNAQGRLDDEYEKDDLRDFALWKTYTEEDGDVYWESPWGKGRPGWHIECSVMSCKYLTDSFEDNKFSPEKFNSIDIHTGAVDLIFPHHTNEIAQSEGATGKQFVRYWVHCEHLFVNGKKMSKSLGNFYTLRDLTKKGYDPRSLRYFYLQAHYKQQLNFTLNALDSAENTLKKIDNFVFFLNTKIHEKNQNLSQGIAKELEQQLTQLEEEFKENLADNLDTPKALATFFKLINLTYSIEQKTGLKREEAKLIFEQTKKFDQVLSILNISLKQDEITEEQKQLIKKREEARKNKNWKIADQIREELMKQNIELIDTTDGTKWRKL